MKLFDTKAQAMGLDLTGNTIRAGLFSRQEQGLCLERCAGGTLPEHLMTPRFTGENIQDPDGLTSIIRKTITACGYRGSSACVSLPDEVVKVMVLPFQELPQDPGEQSALVRWTVSRRRSIPIDDLSLSWQEMGTDSDGRRVLLLLLVDKTVLTAYRHVLRQAGVNPLGLGPTGLNRFNAQTRQMETGENFIYLGLSRRFVTMTGFSGGVPLFFTTVCRGFLGPDSTGHGYDIPLVVDQGLSRAGDTVFSRLFVACHGVDYRQARALFPEKGITRTRTLPPEGGICRVGQVNGRPVTEQPALYTAAAGAAAGAL